MRPEPIVQRSFLIEFGPVSTGTHRIWKKFLSLCTPPADFFPKLQWFPIAWHKCPRIQQPAMGICELSLLGNIGRYSVCFPLPVPLFSPCSCCFEMSNQPSHPQGVKKLQHFPPKAVFYRIPVKTQRTAGLLTSLSIYIKSMNNKAVCQHPNAQLQLMRTAQTANQCESVKK